MRHEHRRRHVSENMPGIASAMRQRAGILAVGAHHQQIDTFVGEARQQHVHGVDILNSHGFDPRIDAMRAQVASDRAEPVFAGAALRFGVDRQQLDILGGAHNRQRVVERAGCLTAAIPGYQHASADVGEVAGIWNHEYRTAAPQDYLLGQIGWRANIGSVRIMLTENREIGIAGDTQRLAISASSLAVITACQSLRIASASTRSRKTAAVASAFGASAPAGSSAATVMTCGSFSANNPVSSASKRRARPVARSSRTAQRELRSRWREMP